MRLALACLPAALLLAAEACSGSGASNEGDIGLPDRDASDPEDGGGTASDAATSPDTTGTNDAGVDAKGPGCNGELDCERVVFVTRTLYTGQLGGVAGANLKCQAAADASPVARIKGRTFLAWLGAAADAGPNAATVAMRLPHGTKPYVLADNAKQVVAQSWNDLTDGTLVNGIDVDEMGVVVPSDRLAWTGTNINGSSSNSTCNDWTSQGGGVNGQRGNVGGNGNGWTDRDNAPCSNNHRLYCFEY